MSETQRRPDHRALVAGALLLAAMAVGSLADPRCASACSCAGTAPLADFDGPGERVLVGRVGDDDGTGLFEFHVERWFHGGEDTTIHIASSTRSLDGENMVWAGCGLDLRTGDHLVLAMSGVRPSICEPVAIVESAPGAALIAEAERVFGSGRSPLVAPVPAPDPDAGQLALAVGIVGLVGSILVLGAVVVARRDRADPEAGPNG